MTILMYTAILTFLIVSLAAKRKSAAPDDDDVDFIAVSDSISDLNNIREQLANVEEMITELTICNSEHNKCIRCEWADSIGKKYNYDLYIDGNGMVTDEMLNIAYTERKRLRSLLRQQIRNLNERCNENCNENYALITSGEWLNDE